jgi:hypothetical protein
MLKENKKMRIVTQGSRGQGYKDLKKRLNAKTKDEVIIKLLERARKAEIKLEKLEEIIGKCAYCFRSSKLSLVISEELI